MSERRFLICGCFPYAERVSKDGSRTPYCMKHDEFREAEAMPNLEGRTATCCDCNAKKPSSPDLAFFEYQGPGSMDCNRLCVCGYIDTVHGRLGQDRPKCGGTFTPRGPLPMDRYYCGCKGWE